MTIPFPAEPMRRALLSSIPAQTSVLPESRYLYVPRLHTRALSFDTMLVRGIRGSGKSVWWAALQDPIYREIIWQTLGHQVLDVNAEVFPGFGEISNPNAYPGQDILAQLLGSYEARDIWWTIVFAHVLDETNRLQIAPFGNPLAPWHERVAWLVGHPEQRERILFQLDKEFEAQKRRKLVLFDALDRTSNHRRSGLRLLRGLLQVLLELRSFRAIRAKAFVRPDMLDNPEVTSFPDASKIVTNDVRLSWSRTDLYNLLWQHLTNAPEGGDVFRENYVEQFGGEEWSFVMTAGIWQIPTTLRNSDTRQEKVFHAITEPYMGRDHRRGLPYSWLPNHLADAQGQISPRSFLAALRNAAELSSNDEGPALPSASIKAGVQAASDIRVLEVVEDFTWIQPTLEALRDLVLPCMFEQIEERWHAANILARLDQSEQKPEHLGDGFVGLRRELESLGFFSRMYDGRVNMPDVYRVSYGLKRKGGIKPVR